MKKPKSKESGILEIQKDQLWLPDQTGWEKDWRC